MTLFHHKKSVEEQEAELAKLQASIAKEKGDLQAQGHSPEQAQAKAEEHHRMWE